MKCPKCKYIDAEMEKEGNKWIDGKEGNFYKLPIEMTRESKFSYHEQRESLYGCPKCGNIFMDIYIEEEGEGK